MILETLDQGLKFLNTEIKNLVSVKIFPGDKAFKLYDTFCFPIDLTEIILEDRNYKLDIKAFQTEFVLHFIETVLSGARLREKTRGLPQSEYSSPRERSLFL